MRPLIIPFFLRNRGCRHRCVFCNERVIAGNAPPITEDAMRRAVREYLASSGGRYRPAEIAFYGGSFTGMPLDEQMELLGVASALIAEGAVQGIRISTRPDDIDGERLRLLASMGVRTVEIGAQSMDDEVLRMSGRGHSAGDIRRAAALCKAKGFETGLHLMAGLPGQNRESFEATVADAVRVAPDSVRIHPVLVFRDTELARLHARGTYRPLTLGEAVTWCKGALLSFARARIPVIRLGLQATGEMGEEGCILAGPWHPAFRGLVEAEIFREMAWELMDRASSNAHEAVFLMAPADLSSFHGPGGRNRLLLESRFGVPVAARPDPAIPRGTLKLQDGQREHGTSIREVSPRV